jgi:hypothetical protein
MNKDERWLCLDCGKDTFKDRDDWYFLRNRLWRQLVPRHQRHGMICRACIERRLGRPLTSDDFRKTSDDELDPEDQPMKKEDYGIIDSLTSQTLHAIDSAMVNFVSSRPRKVGAIMRYMVEESSAEIPWLPDWFFLDRVAELIDARALLVVTEGEDLRFDVVKAPISPADGRKDVNGLE